MNKQLMVKYLLILAKYLFIPIAIIIVFLLGYQRLSDMYGGIYGWDKGAIKLVPLEFFLVTISYYMLFFVLKNNRYRYFLALLPIILFYVFYDYYFVSLGKVFKLCDLSEIPELIDVLPFWQIALNITILLHVVFILVINLTRVWYRYLLPVFIIVGFFVMVSIKPVWYLDGLFNPFSKFGVTQWSDQATAQNGYIASMLYFEASMTNSKALANELYGDGIEYEKSQTQLAEFLKEKNNKRNIHVILMESFFNPQLFAKISYSDAIYAKEFSAMLTNHENAVISPVFGGNTAQAEFEVLCGVPALHKYSSIEFNSFTGDDVFCIPRLLKSVGYRVVASNSYKPSFFNAVNAYKGIGFNEIYFPRQYAPKSNTYMDLVDKEKYIFDGDLFEQNLAFVKSHLEQKDHPPIFNYLLGMYGHLPFTMNENRHPIRLTAKAGKKVMNDEFQRAANQIFYRTQALANYIQKLTKLDPNSLIIIMGDHVPTLGGIQFYEKMAYRNNEEDSIHKPSAFYIINSKFVKKDGLHQYDLITMMFDYLTDNQYCKTYPCQRTHEVLEYQYNMDLARALR
ncbi:MAG: LTA synthase family protein [Methylococcaceae bacterium]|nr:LTA synthase family protein [Methylococcaceae bacterium]